MKLTTRIVDKPWGRTDIPAKFGEFAGRRIGEIWFEAPTDMPSPLMIKYLFTSERLSVQVHPNDDQAQAAGYPRGKDECWLVLAADAGAELGIGLTAPADRETLRAAASDGRIEAMIDWRTARAGDFIYNPAGTIHAIGPGLTVLEVQQNVDVTYRLYDYGRLRELHLDAGLAVARGAPHHHRHDRHIADRGSTLLVDGPKFGLARIDGADRAPLAGATGPFSVIPLTGSCTVGGEAVAPGECAVVDGVGGIAIPDGTLAAIAWATAA